MYVYVSSRFWCTRLLKYSIISVNRADNFPSLFLTVEVVKKEVMS